MAPPKKKKVSQDTDYDEVGKKKANIDAQFGKMNATDRQVGQAPAPTRAPRIPKAPQPATPKPPNPAIPRTPAGPVEDPLTGQPLVKGSPVSAQSNSPLAQAGRQFAYSVDDALLDPLKKKPRPKKGK